MEKYSLDTIGKRIKFYRLNCEITQEVLEEKTDIQRSLISRYERGLDIPGNINLKKIADALNLNISAFTSTPVNNKSYHKDILENELFSRTDFAKRLKKVREEKGLTQVALAEKSGIYHGQIAKYEREYSSPNLYNSILLADTLGTTIDYLLRGENTNSTNQDIIESDLIDIFKTIQTFDHRTKESFKIIFLNIVKGYNHK